MALQPGNAQLNLTRRDALDMAATATMLASAFALMWILSRPSGPAQAKPSLPVPTAPLSLVGANLLGRPDARASLVIFSDFECPYCARFARDVLPAIKARYVETGRLQLAFRHFPLEKHADAMRLASLAECGAKQDRFWAIHDALFANPSLADGDVGLFEHPSTAGLSLDAYRACMSSDATAADVAADRAIGAGLGISGTPSFFVGRLDGQNVVVSSVFAGARPIAEFDKAIGKEIGN